MDNLRDMFAQSKESLDHAVEQLRKERNDNAEILEQHEQLKSENGELRVLLHALNLRLDRQDDALCATNEDVTRLESVMDAKRGEANENIEFLKREMVSSDSASAPCTYMLQLTYTYSPYNRMP